MPGDKSNARQTDVGRRRLLTGIAAGGFAVLAGCGGPGNGDDGNETTDDGAGGTDDTDGAAPDENETTADGGNETGDGNETGAGNETTDGNETADGGNETTDGNETAAGNETDGGGETSTLTVTVSADGEPLSGATVTIEDDAGEVVEEGETDENGEMQAELEDGSYTILADHEEYDEIEETVDIQGEDVEVGVSGGNGNESD